MAWQKITKTLSETEIIFF